MKKYFSLTMSGMAYGLFATLIIGTIIKQIGIATNWQLFLNSGKYLGYLMGAGIGIGIGLSLKKEGLSLISFGALGFITGSLKFLPFQYTFEPDFAVQPGDPLLIYLVVVITILICQQIFKKKTPLDIVLIPMVIIIIGLIINLLIGPIVVALTSGIGELVDSATGLYPIPSAIIISAIMGIALTAPISSAAIAISIGIGRNEIAAGAALIGCCSQMVGFAVMSKKDNKIGEVISIGIGTSMLQFKNIIKKPIIWLPTIITSMILGPIGAIIFKITTNDSGAGMGTAGLVGPITAFDTMGGSINDLFIIIVILIILPAILTYAIYLAFLKFKLMQNGDLKI